MKKLLLFIAVTVAACSPSEDSGTTQPNGSVEVLNWSYQTQPAGQGFVYKYTADVRNTTSESVSGNVVFEYKVGNLTKREYLPITVESNQTVSNTGNWGMIVHDSSEETPTNVVFVGD